MAKYKNPGTINYFKKYNLFLLGYLRINPSKGIQ